MTFQSIRSSPVSTASLTLKPYHTYLKLSPMWLWRKEWSTKENKGKQNHDASIGAAVDGEKTCLGKKQRWIVKKSSL